MNILSSENNDKCPDATTTPLALAIAEHRKAHEAVVAMGRVDDATFTRICNAEAQALVAVASVPCTGAVFLDKLRYIMAREKQVFGSAPDMTCEYGATLIAVHNHVAA